MTVTSQHAITGQTIEERVASLERAVADINQRMQELTPDPDWLEKMKGSMRGMRGFPKVVEYGRQLRESEPYSDEHEAEV